MKHIIEAAEMLRELPIVTSEQLTYVSKNLLKAAGASDEEAMIVTNFLVRSNLAGIDSHGVFPNLDLYIKGLRDGVIKPGARSEIVRDEPSVALIDGNWGFGQVTCFKATELAIEKARKNGVGVIGVFNCNHIGRLTDYAEMIFANDMIAFIVVQGGDPNVAPHGGKKVVLSTNPICFGIPAGEEEPIVVDFATSAVAEGRIRAALYRGETLPPGWILDAEGRPSTNPADLYEPPLPPQQTKMAGALLPAGGHKGYGLALAVDALAGALTGSGCSPEVTSELTNGVFIMALRIDRFVPVSSFKATIDRLIRKVKGIPKAPGVAEILIPGEPELREEMKRRRDGISIPESAWSTLTNLWRYYNLDPHLMPST